MASQVEAVDHVIEVALHLRLVGEVLLPLPLLEEVPGEEVSVRVALRVELRARVPVPIPRAAHTAAGLQEQRREAGLAGAVQLVDAGDPSAHHQHVDLSTDRHRPGLYRSV